MSRLPVVLAAVLTLAACGASQAPAAAVGSPVAGTPAGATPAGGLPAGALTAADAAGRVGQSATVCGRVASATFASSSSGQPTFLNLERPYPDAVFVFVIWPEYRSQYSAPPESLFAGKVACASGVISTYRGTAQIEAGAGVTLRQ